MNHRDFAQALQYLTPEELGSMLEEMADDEIARVLNTWQFIARPEQLCPRDCNDIWMMMTGRGFGKTRSAAEYTLDYCENWGPDLRGILASKTIGDTREDMILGDAGLIACADRRGYNLDYKPGRAVIYHPAGGLLRLTSGEIPDGCRGPNVNFFWADELASWKKATRVWSNLMFCWRICGPNGESPRGVISTTPQPCQIMTRLVRSGEFRNQITITTGTTLDNAANLSPAALQRFLDVYQGTQLGEQEMNGILLLGRGIIVEQDTIHHHRVDHCPEVIETIVSVDPAISDDENSDQAGIAVIGLDDRYPSHVYVRHAAGYARGKSVWAKHAIDLAEEFRADKIIAEVNQGGDYITSDIQVANEARLDEGLMPLDIQIVPVFQKKSKRARATPVGALYERGRVHHVGHFVQAERELTTWTEDAPSPNIMDAIVQGVSHLVLDEHPGSLAGYL